MRSPRIRPDARPIHVLLGLWEDDRGTQYADQLVEGSADDVRFSYFSWREALLGRYDVFHVHWPEMLVRARRPWEAFLRRRAYELVLVRCRFRRAPVVRTVHNIAPHETGDRAERRVLDHSDRATCAVIRLNDQTPVEFGRFVATIPHGHYRPRFDPLPRSEIISGRMLFIGIVRPYKGVLALIRAFRDVPDPTLTLRIVGSPGAGQAELVQNEIAGDPRASAELTFVSDADFVREISAAELVVFPYRQMLNSGVLLAALSVDRPVLVPRSATNIAIAAEVGPEWFVFYDSLDAATLEGALVAARSARPSGRPRLSQRDWRVVSEEHRRVYVRALEETAR